MDVIERAEIALSARCLHDSPEPDLRALIVALKQEVSNLRAIGNELLEDKKQWIENGDHCGPLDPEQWELFVCARKIINPEA